MNKLLQVMAGAENGGAEEFFMRLAAAFSRTNINQKIIIRKHTERRSRLESCDIDVTETPFGGLIDFATKPIIKRQINYFKPEIVLAWMSRAARYCPAGDHTLVARLGGYYNLKYYKHCDHLIGNTEDIRQYLIDEGWPENRAWYIPNFVDCERKSAICRNHLETPIDAPLLLALGRLHENKAFDVLIAALSDVPDAFLWIAGDGPLEQLLRKQTIQSGVDGRVRFLGWRQNIGALLATADILVCPSRHEPLGNVVIEGWAHNVPVVAAESVGPSALIEHQKTGLLVPINDSRSLAKAINYILSDEALAENLISHGFATYEASYTELKVVRQYQEFFEKVTR